MSDGTIAILAPAVLAVVLLVLQRYFPDRTAIKTAEISASATQQTELLTLGQQIRGELRADLERAQDELKQARADLKDAQIQIEKVSAENLQLKAENVQLKSRVTTLEQENCQLNERVAALEQKGIS